MLLGAGLTNPNSNLAMAVSYARSPTSSYDVARTQANVLLRKMGGSEHRPDSEATALAEFTTQPPLRARRVPDILGQFFLECSVLGNAAYVLLWRPTDTQEGAPAWTHAFALLGDDGDTYKLFDAGTGKLYTLNQHDLTGMLEQRNGGEYRAYVQQTPDEVVAVPVKKEKEEAGAPAPAAAADEDDEEEEVVAPPVVIVKKAPPVRKRAAPAAVPAAPAPQGQGPPETKRANVAADAAVVVEK